MQTPYEKLNETHRLLCQVTGELSGSLIQRKITKRKLDQYIKKIQEALTLLNS
jgi:hypothetical protein